MLTAKLIVIIEKETNEDVEVMDVTAKSEGMRDRCYMGVLTQLNRDSFSVEDRDYFKFEDSEIRLIKDFAELEGGEVWHVENHKHQQSITIRYKGSYGGLLQFWANGNLTDLRRWEGVGEDESWEINNNGRLVLS
jgi:hypothetical protein